jgi:HEAT repeat protein
MTMTPAPVSPGRRSPPTSSLHAASRWLAALATVLFVAHAGAASAEPTPSSTASLRARVEALLQQPDSVLNEADWKRLGPEALALLEEVAADPNAPSAWRVRAVTSMALVDHPDAVNRLRALLEDAGTHPTLRASAALALSLRSGPESLAALQPHLQDGQQQVREAVALAIGRLGSIEAQKALEERLPLEEDLLVRDAIQQGLTLVEP